MKERSENSDSSSSRYKPGFWERPWKNMINWQSNVEKITSTILPLASNILFPPLPFRLFSNLFSVTMLALLLRISSKIAQKCRCKIAELVLSTLLNYQNTLFIIRWRYCGRLFCSRMKGKYTKIVAIRTILRHYLYHEHLDIRQNLIRYSDKKPNRGLTLLSFRTPRSERSASGAFSSRSSASRHGS